MTSTAFARRTIPVNAEPRISGFQRAGMLDWPGRLSATVFLSGCNLRCPFCHNPDLVLGHREDVGAESLLAHLRERKGWLDGIVVTGGEPCIDPELPRLLSTLRAEGLPVKLDTNGTRPEVLRSLIDEGLIDFVALDVKSTPERYQRACGASDPWPSVAQSIHTILDSGVDHEFRTTCYPPAVGPSDFAHIAAQLAGGMRYVLQQFRPVHTLDPAAVSVRSHSADTLHAAAARCSTFLPTFVRGAS